MQNMTQNKNKISMPLPLMIPSLPKAESLMPFLKRIDENGNYTNFGPLQEELSIRLLELQPGLNNAPHYSVCVSSATLGLEIVLSSLGLPKGSLVAIPALTFIATASAVIRCGLIPTVLDVDMDDWMLKPEMVSRHPKIKSISAVVPVATFGMPQDANLWSRWSKEHGIPVIIDAAGAIGAQAMAPNIILVFSLHATKPVSAGEGGLIVTDDEAVAYKIRKMTNYGFGLSSPATGTNAKLSEYHAAVGLATLNEWNENSLSRLKLYRTYVNHLSNLCAGQIIFQRDTGHVAPCIFPIRMPSSKLRDEIELIFSAEQIGFRRWYLPLIQNQPMLKGVDLSSPTPISLQIEETLLGLPFSLKMNSSDVERVVSIIESTIL
jgi:dTDP-4-amino-4,6-dideoxygalactose transaminase